MMMVAFLFSCTQSPLPAPEENSEVSSDLKNSLVGMWQAYDIIVGIDTIHNSGNSALLEVNNNDWRDKLKLRPIQTIFNANNTYVSAYCTDEGRLIRVTSGKWDMKKNQLNIHQLFPNDKEMNYRIELSAGVAQLRSKLDFDGDGKSDDMYYCQMKKVGDG